VLTLPPRQVELYSYWQSSSQQFLDFRLLVRSDLSFEFI
jgi:hypothetical protein